MIINCNYLHHFLKGMKFTVEELHRTLPAIGIEAVRLPDYEGDELLEIEITPNRPDCLCHYGIAREIAARYPQAEFVPEKVEEIEKVANFQWKLIVENEEDCWRYSYAVLTGLKVQPSSPNLQKLIASLGLRPINNLVDISNLVMLTIGHPVHFFDLQNLYQKQIQVRRARKGEKLVLLDETELELDSDYLLIADGQRPVALAGVMGGLESGVSEQTTAILIESAMFNPVVVRRMVRKSGVHSDAAYRFERGMDFAATVKAIQLVLTFFHQEGITFQLERFEDLVVAQPQKVVIDFDYGFLRKFAGIDVPEVEAERILKRLGFKIERNNLCWKIEVPTHRLDVNGKEDIVEEILRIYGYDRLPSTLPEINAAETFNWKTRENFSCLQNNLHALRFNEAVNFIFLSKAENEPFLVKKPIELENPLGSDFSQLRSSLLAGLLKNTRHNLNNFASGVMLYEIGKSFSIEDNLPEEKEMLGIVACGFYQEKNWVFAERKIDYFVFKSLICTLLEQCRISYCLQSMTMPIFEAESCFKVEIGGKVIGYFGQLSSQLLAKYDINQPVYAAEFLLSDLLQAIGDYQFVPWPVLPYVRRDFSFLINRNQSFQKIWEFIESEKPLEVERFQLLERYEPKGADSDKVSYLIAFYYRDRERTLTDTEVNQLHQGFITRMIAEFNLIPR